jgi:hypothetical protein
VGPVSDDEDGEVMAMVGDTFVIYLLCSHVFDPAEGSPADAWI